MNYNNMNNVNEGESFGMLDMLAIFSLVLQLIDHDKNSKQLTNDDLMRELQSQDRKYLDKIIENQNEILSILKEISNSPQKADYSPHSLG